MTPVTDTLSGVSINTLNVPKRLLLVVGVEIISIGNTSGM